MDKLPQEDNTASDKLSNLKCGIHYESDSDQSEHGKATAKKSLNDLG